VGETNHAVFPRHLAGEQTRRLGEHVGLGV
jgi:hypothetical protein